MQSDVLEMARDGNRHAVEQVLLEFYPTVHRMAYGLAGRDDAGKSIVRFVMWQATKVLPKWTVEGMPQRWFYHHTIITWRRAPHAAPDVRSDTLVRPVQDPPAAYLAFIQALRGLPVQQQEAFLLHHGERFDARLLAVAMDCSREAASNHLQAAETELKAVAGDHFEKLTQGMIQAYQHLLPAEKAILSHVRRHVGRRAWRRRLLRLLKLLPLLVLLAAIAYAAWWIYNNFEIPGLNQP